MSNMASNVKARISSRVEYRTVIRHLKGNTGKDIHAELVDGGLFCHFIPHLHITCGSSSD